MSEKALQMLANITEPVLLMIHAKLQTMELGGAFREAPP